MTTTIATAKTRIETFVEAVEHLDAKAKRVKSTSLARGWGKGAGEHSIYRGGAAVDEVLDLYILAKESDMSGSATACEEFISVISKRPGAVMCEEIERFCADLIDIANS